MRPPLLSLIVVSFKAASGLPKSAWPSNSNSSARASSSVFLAFLFDVWWITSLLTLVPFWLVKRFKFFTSQKVQGDSVISSPRLAWQSVESNRRHAKILCLKGLLVSVYSYYYTWNISVMQELYAIIIERTKIKEELMAIKKPVGRPQEFNLKIVGKLADSVSHNYSISDACKFARISRSTYYFYLNNEPLFAEVMVLAYENRRKVKFNFRTTY